MRSERFWLALAHPLYGLPHLTSSLRKRVNLALSPELASHDRSAEVIADEDIPRLSPCALPAFGRLERGYPRSPELR